MSEASFTVRLLPHGGAFECSGGKRLLDVAIAAGYWLPHSCRDGSCRSCHLRVVEGEVSGAEDGHCLTCQSQPLSDLTLDAPACRPRPASAWRRRPRG